MLGPSNSAKLTNDWQYQPAVRPMWLNTIGQAQYSNTESTLSAATSTRTFGYAFYAVPISVIQSIGTGDFTIEFWVYVNSTNARGMVRIDQYGPSFSSGSGLNPVLLFMDHIFSDLVVTSGSAAVTETTPNVFDRFTWQSVALVRSSGVATLYFNGDSTNTTGPGAMTVDFSDAGFAQFGGGGSSSDPSYIQELRVSNIARYTSNYTPATTQFTNDSNTLLLCHFTGTPGDNLFLDDDS